MAALHPDWLRPDWPAPVQVHALCTTRAGGYSRAPFDALNLGDHVGDDPRAVQGNRQVLQEALQQAIQRESDDGAHDRARRAGGFGNGHQHGHIQPGNQNQVHQGARVS